MNNKGFIDNVYLMMLFFTALIGTIIGILVYNQIKDGLNENELFSNDTDIQGVFNSTDTAIYSMDNGISIFFFGLIIAEIMGMYFTRSNPVLFIIGFILLVVTVFVSIILRGAITTVIDSSPEFTEVIEDMPKSSFILENLPAIILIVSSIILIILYINKGGTISG